MSDDEQGVKVYVTKWCLTKGVIECTVKDWCLNIQPDGSMVKVVWPKGLNGTACFFGMDWWRDKDAANRRHRALVTDKIYSLNRHIERLQRQLRELDGDEP